MKLLTGRRLSLIALVVGVGVAAGGIAYASIPDSSGLIHGCFQKDNGNLRVVDSSGKGCGTSEKSLDWSQTGPTGTNGTNGTNGVSGYELVQHDELYQAPFGSDPVPGPSPTALLANSRPVAEEKSLSSSATHSSAGGRFWRRCPRSRTTRCWRRLVGRLVPFCRASRARPK